MILLLEQHIALMFLLAVMFDYCVGIGIRGVKVYQTMPAGIGEHSDVTEAVIAELDKMSAAHDRIEMIEKYFSKNDD